MEVSTTKVTLSISAKENDSRPSSVPKRAFVPAKEILSISEMGDS